MKTQIFLSLALSFCLFNLAKAQVSNQASTKKELSFFIGSWSGKGAFSSGKNIEANLNFSFTLDSAWIYYEHTDKLPNKYKANSLWAIDSKTGQMSSYIFDNSGGSRKFTGNGFIDNKLILSYESETPKGTVFQHFIYEKTGEKTFKMTYEVSTDNQKWRMIDYLDFIKTT